MCNFLIVPNSSDRSLIEYVTTAGMEHLRPMELLMKCRLIAVFFSFAYFSWSPVVRASEDEPKPDKKIVRTEDGLNIVCEVSGKGDNALVFLHGWCGDRAYWKNQVDVFAPN